MLRIKKMEVPTKKVGKEEILSLPTLKAREEFEVVILVAGNYFIYSLLRMLINVFDQ